jgi:hypothetical protein
MWQTPCCERQCRVPRLVQDDLPEQEERPYGRRGSNITRMRLRGKTCVSENRVSSVLIHGKPAYRSAPSLCWRAAYWL